MDVIDKPLDWRLRNDPEFYDAVATTAIFATYTLGSVLVVALTDWPIAPWVGVLGLILLLVFHAMQAVQLAATRGTCEVNLRRFAAYETDVQQYMNDLEADLADIQSHSVLDADRIDQLHGIIRVLCSEPEQSPERVFARLTEAQCLELRSVMEGVE